jgi:hypothetical protein
VVAEEEVRDRDAKFPRAKSVPSAVDKGFLGWPHENLRQDYTPSPLPDNHPEI